MRLEFYSGRTYVSPFDLVDDFGHMVRLEMPEEFTSNSAWYRCCAFYADGNTDPALFERHERMTEQ